MVLLVLGLASCNKDQKAVKKLDGSWKATSYLITDDGVSVDYVDQGLELTMTFDNCKLKDDEWCNLTQVLVFQGDTETDMALYKVQGDGTQMIWKDSETSTSTTTLSITELTKSNLTIVSTEDGETASLVFEKL